MSYLLDAMAHLGVYYTPSRVLSLGYGDGKTSAAEDDDADPFAEFEPFWPALPDLDGVDRFAQYPVAGLPSADDDALQGWSGL